jgi:hypothetical protein
VVTVVLLTMVMLLCRSGRPAFLLQRTCPHGNVLMVVPQRYLRYMFESLNGIFLVYRAGLGIHGLVYWLAVSGRERASASGVTHHTEAFGALIHQAEPVVLPSRPPSPITARTA